MQTAFFTRVNGMYKRILFDDMLYVVAHKNYCEVILSGGKKICLYASLTNMEKKLPENLFLRIHRSYVVSIAKIEGFDNHSVIIGAVQIPVSKSYFNQLLQRIIVVNGDNNHKAADEINGMDIKQYLKENTRKQNSGNL